jgi:transposase
MILEIPDDEKDKIEFCRRALGKYALTTYKVRSEAAAFLGISIRALSDWVNRYEELRHFKLGGPYKGTEEWRRLSDTRLWKTRKL